MARAHSFWVIVDGTVPTAFRSKERDDLVPTLHQLQRTQPNVALVWFERGRSWDSPAAAREAFELRRKTARDRKPTWRPGGAHVDPREKYKLTRDEKRARFKKRARRDFEGDRSPDGGRGDTGPGRRPDHPGGSRDFGREKRPERPRGQSGSGVGSEKKFSRPKGPRPPHTGPSRGPWQARRPGGPWRPKGPRGPKGPKSRS